MAKSVEEVCAMIDQLIHLVKQDGIFEPAKEEALRV